MSKNKKKPVALVHCTLSQPGGKVIKRFDTVRAAEAYLGEIEKDHPVEVYRGEYSIDAPEGWEDPAPKSEE